MTGVQTCALPIWDGRVSVSAKDATVRQILTEWARVGQTRIVNLERLGGGPLTLELANVPEAQALDTLLRSVSGYLAAPRAVTLPDASQYDRILLLPTSTAVASAPPRLSPPANPPPAFQPPQFVQPDEPSDDEVVVPPPGTPGGPLLPRPRGGPATSIPIQPQGVPPQDAPQPPAQPQAPAAPVEIGRAHV